MGTHENETCKRFAMYFHPICRVGMQCVTIFLHKQKRQHRRLCEWGYGMLLIIANLQQPDYAPCLL